MNESPHWLETEGRTKEALAILQKMARWNGVEETCGLSFDPKSYSSRNPIRSDVIQKERFYKIWTHKRLVIRFIVFSYGW